MLRLALVLCSCVLARGSNAVGEKFLADNKNKEGVITLPSGMQYKVLRQGDGTDHPTLDSPCECHYEGKLIDGTEFDSSYGRGEPASFPVNGVIKGWTEALQMMKEGSHWHLFIPSELAYGSKGAGGGLIPPNSILTFDIELLEVK